MSVLLDSSLLIAASLQGHVHNEAADHWLTALDDRYATCPITQGALIRIALQSDYTLGEASELLEQITSSDQHDFWPDDIDYLNVEFRGLVGHRQVTDAYLAQLARHRGEKVATLDRGFVSQHPDVAELVPTS